MGNFNRFTHSYGVAKKMQKIGKINNFWFEDIEGLFILGLAHDIGYEFTENGINHNKIGGQILKERNFEYWKEVYYHGEVTDEYHSIFLDVLNIADMMIDGNGIDVGYEKRLEEIGITYGLDSDTYRKSKELVDYLKTVDLIVK